ncbi:ABC transporter substrate-binding protein [Labrys okinawensis]|uniref:ABC transporter substrate-binding protein n=1 Tax=Labrys okinawensis TaxID=346911 RepID=UPI0039BC7F2A
MSVRKRLLMTALGCSVLMSPIVPVTSAEAADTVHVAMPDATTILDPIKSPNGGDIAVYGQLYTHLVRRNWQTGEIEPGLAERWEISADGLTYTFHLRDAKFSDHSPITGADVAFSLERVRTDPLSVFAAPLQAVTAITAQDDKTVVVKLKYPFAPLLANLEIWNMGIVSKNDVEKRGADKAFSDVPVSSGPYTVSEWKPNDKIVLKPNQEYWRKGHPKSQNDVEIVTVSSAQTREAMLRAGDIDIMGAVEWSQIDGLKSFDKVDMRLEPSTTLYQVRLNNKREPFSRVDARQAAAMAIDVKAVAAAVTHGYGIYANTTLPSTLLFHNTEYPGIGYDLKKSAELIASSGMRGHDIKILAAPGTAEQQLSVLIQAQLMALGLKPVIVNMDEGARDEAVSKGDYDATVSLYFNETPDPDGLVRWALCGTCGSDSNGTFYENPTVDKLTDEGTRELDPAKRSEIYKKIQEITTNEVANIPLFNAPNPVAYSKKIQGLLFTPALGWTFEDMTTSK